MIRACSFILWLSLAELTMFLLERRVSSSVLSVFKNVDSERLTFHCEGETKEGRARRKDCGERIDWDIRGENKAEDERDLFTDSEGMEAMFLTRAIILKIEQDKNTDL